MAGDTTTPVYTPDMPVMPVAVPVAVPMVEPSIAKAVSLSSKDEVARRASL